MMVIAATATAIDIDTESKVLAAAMRMNANDLSGGGIKIAIAMKEIMAVTGFVAILAIGTQGYFGNQGRSLNVPWLTSVLSALIVLSMTGAIAGYLLGTAGFDFEEEVKNTDQGNKNYTVGQPLW